MIGLTDVAVFFTAALLLMPGLLDVLVDVVLRLVTPPAALGLDAFDVARIKTPIYDQFRGQKWGFQKNQAYVLKVAAVGTLKRPASS
ncbi:hypothetical protein [Acidocella facilis]|uniref:hypothetical protein n=1 Tax=Acidocella facilis TaxID=525 RepID=UPI001F237835|nr:hypothetical protein [Acidocella facilis]